MRRWLTVFGFWLKAFWPVVASVGCAATVFREAVIDSIRSTPHPGLVYTIFTVLAAAVCLAAHALQRYMREESLARALLDADPSQRPVVLAASKWRSDLLPVYHEVLRIDVGHSASLHQQKIESELFVAEEHLMGRLTLPGFLGGALVGVGLVGTFVGLLSSLADLGNLFSSLINVGGASSDPVAMFSDMLKKLQEPLRGMGTAFVASLYGLAGSLIMGLVLYSVRKTGAHAMARARQLLRLARLEGENKEQENAWGEAAWERLFAVMDAERNLLANSVDQFAGMLKEQLSLMSSLSIRIDESSIQTSRLSEVLISFDSMGYRMLSGQERVNKNLLSLENTLSGSMERMLEQLRDLARPRTALMINAVAVLVMVAAVVSMTSTWLNYRLSVQILERMPMAAAAAAEAHERGDLPAPAMPSAPAEGSNPLLMPPPPMPPAPIPQDGAGASAAGEARTVTVKRGDQLEMLARKYGVSLAALLRANKDIVNPNKLTIGQELTIPAAEQTPSGQ